MSNNRKIKNKSIKWNFIMNSILSMSSTIFPLITFPYISRVLLPIGTGKISFATSVITYFNMFAQLGIPTYGIRACAKVRDDRQKLTRLAQELLLFNLIMSFFSYLILAGALIFVPRLHEEKCLYIIISMTILLSAIGMEWLYKALEQYTYITIRSIIFKFIALIFMFLLIHSPSDYVIYGGITIFAASASNIFNFINVHKYIDLKPTYNYNLKQHIKPIIIFFAMSCATTIYTNLDTVMLGFMKTDQDVGYYNASVKIKNVLVTIVASLGTVLLPRSSYYVENNRFDEFIKICKKAMNFTILIALPLAVYFIIFAREGIFFLSGEAYKGAILPMKIIMPTILFIGITNILGTQMLVPLGKEKKVLFSELAGALVDLILNTIFIPKYGAAGAAIGTLIAEFVVLIIQGFVLGNLTLIVSRQIQFGKIIFGVLIASAVASVFKVINWGNFMTLLFSACAFFGVYGVILIGLKESLSSEILNQMIYKIKKKKY